MGDELIMTIETITQKIRLFRDQRDWAQFHNPKDMAEAISIEASELLQEFLWKTPQQSANLNEASLSRVEDEIADVAIYLFELVDLLKIDLLAIMDRKIQKNADKYPISKAKGKSLKYTDL